METSKILNDLRAELNHVVRAISALEQLDGAGSTAATAKAAPKRGGRRRISAAGRKRISEAAKARWAARRKGVAKPASGRRTMSTAARKKIAEAQRKRWAAVKKVPVKKPAKKVTAGKAAKAKQGSSGAGMMDLLKSVFQ